MKCITCGRIKAVVQMTNHMYRCGHCGTMFDDNPDEGSDYSDFRPSARMEREERRRENKWGKRDDRV